MSITTASLFFNILPRLIQGGGCVSSTLHSVSNAIKPYYREPLIRASLTKTHFAVKTCIEGFNHGTRIGRSWGAGLQHGQYLICNNGSGIGRAGCCTQVEFENKPAADLIGNLAHAKARSAVSVISFFASKYVGDLKWDFLIIGQKCERLEPFNTPCFRMMSLKGSVELSLWELLRTAKALSAECSTSNNSTKKSCSLIVSMLVTLRGLMKSNVPKASFSRKDYPEPSVYTHR